MFDITIGTGETFTVHSHVLVRGSKYFKAAMTGPFEEGKTKKITLAEAFCPKAFALLLQWAYADDVTNHPASSVITVANSPLELATSGALLGMDMLTAVWVLADYCLMPRLQNHIIDIFMIRTCVSPPSLKSTLGLTTYTPSTNMI